LTTESSKSFAIGITSFVSIIYSRPFSTEATYLIALDANSQITLSSSSKHTINSSIIPL